jgi:hypothetical protein
LQRGLIDWCLNGCPPEHLQWILYAFFWVTAQCLNFICWHFRTLCLFHLHTPVDMTDN